MDRKKFRECKALLFDFGGTIDADGEHWLDRFFALYEDEGLDFRQEEIKRAFYHADAVCHADPGVPLILRNSGSFSFSRRIPRKCFRLSSSLAKIIPRHSTGPVLSVSILRLKSPSMIMPYSVCAYSLP